MRHQPWGGGGMDTPAIHESHESHLSVREQILFSKCYRLLVCTIFYLVGFLSLMGGKSLLGGLTSKTIYYR